MADITAKRPKKSFKIYVLKLSSDKKTNVNLGSILGSTKLHIADNKQCTNILFSILKICTC